MTVMTSGVGEGDFELYRGADNRIGVHWEEYVDGRYQPKDLRTWACTLYLEDAVGQTFFQTGCSVTSSGDVWGDVPASALPTILADAKRRGKWRIVGKQGTKTELVGHGDFRVS